MDARGLVLVIPDRPDLERDAMAKAWEKNGGSVLRLGRFWEPPELVAARVRLYGNDAFCQVLAEKLSLRLVSPADDLILGLSREWVKRDIGRVTLAEAIAGAFPAFVKPLAPKLFRAGVYQRPADLEHECRGLPADSDVVISEVVQLRAEARAFVLDGMVCDCAVYEGEGCAADARDLVAEVARRVELPATVVVDVGLIPGRGWAVVEFNASWGAGLNGCRAEKVWPCIARATVAL